MSIASPEARRFEEQAFLHEALLYRGEDEFVERSAAFVRDAVAAGEPTLVMVGTRKLERLRTALAGAGDGVCFADMEDVGANPARIIPAWEDFVRERAPSAPRLRGIGEPIWADRSPAELVECQRHESLLNLAFADAAPFHLLCPYDLAALDPDVIDEARCSHPLLADGDLRRPSGSYRGLEAVRAPFDGALPDPPPEADELFFTNRSLKAVRRAVADRAGGAGLTAAKTYDLVMAVNEVATNSVVHGGGEGTLRIWRDAEALICEVRDGGEIDEPLAGRLRPATDGEHGYGLWMAHQLCDLVQMRAVPPGNVIRMHMRRPR